MGVTRSFGSEAELTLHDGGTYMVGSWKRGG